MMNRFKVLHDTQNTRIVLTTFIIIIVGGCAYQPGSFEDPWGFNIVSQSTEVQMGQEAAREIETEVRIVTDPQVQNYISKIGQHLVQTSRRADIVYQFKVVDTEEINAFALPGGFIYVNRGLITEAGNEAELVGVIAHEIGHVASRHGAKRMSTLIAVQMGFAVFQEMSDNDRSTQIKLLIANALATGFLLKNSRDYERQADDYGAENLYLAGYDPMGMARFFDKLAQQHSPSSIEVFLSTHPSPGERVRNVEALVATFPPKSYITDTPEFQQVKHLLSGRNFSTPLRQKRTVPGGRLRQKVIGGPRRR